MSPVDARMPLFPRSHGARLISLREEEPPNDAVVVVRAGLMRLEIVRRAASDAHEALGFHTVSVYLALNEPVEVLCRREPRLNRYRRVRLSAVGRLRRAGFALIPTFSLPHYSIVFPDLADPTLQRLEAAFDPPVPNPGRA